jgi:hypothetical protein
MTGTPLCRRVEAFRDKQVLLERRLALGRAGVAAALKALGATPTLASRPEDPGNVYATLLQVRDVQLGNESFGLRLCLAANLMEVTLQAATSGKAWPHRRSDQ